MTHSQSSMASFTATYLPYIDTGAFAPVVTDYLAGKPSLKEFYRYNANLDGIKAAIEARKQYPFNRALLVAELTRQYSAITTTEKVKANIRALSNENTFTICTAHQPNIFTGHLYFIYKIVHAIRLAEELKTQLPVYDFVPVYYMGSEDADLEELGEVNINGKKYTWNTSQKGAVGRMIIDKPFLQLMEEISGQLSFEPFGNDILSVIKACYIAGSTIEQATLLLVNRLFSEYGLLVLLPDHPALKAVFHEVNKKELEERFSQPLVAATIARFPAEYKVQAAGRAINLFYLLGDKRERIEAGPNGFTIANTNLVFSGEEMSEELENHPERFSPNVILRPVFQEMVLPNVAFIGGGGELAYWLELQKVFEAVQVPYPVLILRNSFTIIPGRAMELMHKLQLSVRDIFVPLKELQERTVKKESDHTLSLEREITALDGLYATIQKAATGVDQSLFRHAEALRVQALKRLEELEKKMLKAEKKKFAVQLQQLQKLKERLFPGNTLQERVDNLLPYYAQWGPAFIRAIYEHSKGLQMEFCVLSER